MRRPEAVTDAVSPDFGIELRVYYQDTDAGGVVYHANYLNFFERARTEWLRHLGYDVAQMARSGHLFVARRMQLRFLRPAHLDDTLRVTVSLERLGRAQLTLFQRVIRAAEVLVEASVNVACVDPQGFRPVALPEALYAELDSSAAKIQQNDKEQA